MNVVSSTRTEVDYTFKMSQSDLDRYLADPKAWRDDVQAQLKGSVVGTVGGDGEVKPRRAKTSRGKRKAPAKNGRARSLSGPYQKVLCVHCSRPIARSRMPRHLATQHGHANGSAPTQDPEPAGAAG